MNIFDFPHLLMSNYKELTMFKTNHPWKLSDLKMSNDKQFVFTYLAFDWQTHTSLMCLPLVCWNYVKQS